MHKLQDAAYLDDVVRVLYRHNTSYGYPYAHGHNAALATVPLLYMCLDRNLVEVARGKHEYNKTRPYRHGGKRLC